MRRARLAFLVVASGCSHHAVPTPAAPDAGQPAVPTPGGSGEQPGIPPSAPDAHPPADASPAPAPSGPVPGDCASLFNHGAVSAWVAYGPDGKLKYKTIDEQGDRIMDFSGAGYGGGGVAIPTVPVVEMVKPSGGDDTAAIQAAIDAVAQRPLVDGIRGAVLLARGNYRSAGTIKITASGVVLRGSGSGDGGTEIAIEGAHLVFQISGGGTRQVVGPKATITDDHVPAGARSFTVDAVDGFKVGDPVLISRPVTAAWKTFMGMDAFPGWIGPGFVYSWERSITAIEGKTVTLDVPVPDSLDRKMVDPPGGSMQKYSWDGRISQVGIESLRIRAPKRTGSGPKFLDMTNTVDSWLRDIEGWNTVEGIYLDSGSRRITVQRARVMHDPTTFFSEAAPFDFDLNASEVLIDRSASKGGLKIMMVTTHYALGPNVVLNFDADGDRSHIQPHMNWSTGLLVDSSVVSSEGTQLESAVGFINRGHAGSDHGWALGWGVAWNCTAPSILLQKPPGSMVWAIGCKTTPSEPAPAVKTTAPLMPPGIYESVNTPVAPSSLYLAQLCERLGPQALANIGYSLAP